MEVTAAPEFDSDSSHSPSNRRGRGISAISPPAGFIRRAIAYGIDSAIIAGLYFLLLFVGLAGIRSASGVDSLYFSGSGRIAMAAMSFLYIAYFTFFHANGGQTPAKRILRIKVISANGSDLSLLHALLRTFGYALSFLFLGAGFFLAAIEGQKRALHDLLAYTRVVLAP